VKLKKVFQTTAEKLADYMEYDVNNDWCTYIDGEMLRTHIIRAFDKTNLKLTHIRDSLPLDGSI